MYGIIKHYPDGRETVIAKRNDFVALNDRAMSLNEDWDDPEGATYIVKPVTGKA